MYQPLVVLVVNLISHVWLFTTSWTVGCRRLLSPWHSPGKNTGVGFHFLLQGIFPTQGSNPFLLRWQMDSVPLSHQGSFSHLDNTYYLPGRLLGTFKRNWNRVDLHCCVSFRCTAKWFSYTHTYIFFFRFFSCIGYCKILSIIPVLYRRFLSFIYFIYDDVHQVNPKLLFIFPSSPFPKSLFSVYGSVSVL